MKILIQNAKYKAPEYNPPGYKSPKMCLKWL